MAEESSCYTCLMSRFYSLIRIFLILVILGFVGSVIGGFSLYYMYAQDLPKLDNLEDYNPPVVSEVFSNDGTKIGEFWTEKRYVLSPKELPKALVQAIVAGEDDRFFEHKGIDFQGIFRAMIENLKAGQVVQGGSTITQQVTKSLLLTRERTFTRKIKEAILARKIEEKFSKDEILFLYLNQVFFGNRSYGIEAAARNYFHKSARELNVAEAAMIAGLAKAPSTYSPIKNPKRAKERQEYVIDRMYQVGYINKDQAKQAKDFKMKVYPAKTDKEFNYDYAPWFTEYIRRYVQQKYGEQVPYTHGLKIYTSVDLKMQRAANEAVQAGIYQLDKRQGYAGPIRHIDPNDIEDFSKKNHLKISRKHFQKVDIYSRPTKEEIESMTTPLDDELYYEAVINSLDSKAENIHILVGNHEGTIRVHDYKWARERNLHTAGADYYYYVRDPKKKFSVGDVILVKVKHPTDEEKKKQNYSDGVDYFSLEQEPEVESALFSYEPQTGLVKAMIGGRDFKKSEFNRAMQALRQTGSVFKPFLYAAALDKGYKPTTVIEDAPIYYEYSPGRFWSPQNYGGGYKGPTSFRSALVNSRNVVSVRILMDIGTDYTAAFVRKLGISTPMKRYYSMALGANDMKLFEVARAFGVFANGGILPELVFVKRMTDRYGRVLEEYEAKEVVPFQEQIKENLAKSEEARQGDGYNEALLAKGEEWIKKDKIDLTEIEKKILYGEYIPKGYTISPRTAYTMVQLMNDIVNYGTGYKVRALNRPAAGKTGTTNDESDAWFVGYVPNLVAGVWVGFDKVQKIGGRETGGKTAAPVFLYYMQHVLEGTEVAKFDIPKEINESSLDAPIDITAGDPEAGGIPVTGGAEFFLYDF